MNPCIINYYYVYYHFDVLVCRSLLAWSWAQMGVCSELIPEFEDHRQEENADQASDWDYADMAQCVPWVSLESRGDSQLVMSRIIFCLW